MIPSSFVKRLVPAAILLVLAGCKPPATPPVGQNPSSGEPSLQSPGDAHQRPGTAELTNFLRRSVPAGIKLVELKNDPPVPKPGTPPGGNAWLYNVRVTFAATEDQLGPPPPQDARAFQDLTEELDGLVAWSQAYAQSPYVGLYPGFSVTPPSPASPQLLMIIRPKDQPAPAIYGKMAAEWQVDHWQYSLLDADLPEEDDGGKPRSAFTGPILIQGEAATERFLAAAKATVADAKGKKAAIEHSYQADLSKGTQPGIIYKGQLAKGDKTMPAEVRFIASPGGDDPTVAWFELRLPASGYVYTCSAKLAREVPNLSPTVVKSDGALGGSIVSAPKTDLVVNYESVNKPRFNLADALANDFLYSHMGEQDIELSLRGHQLKGKLAGFDFKPHFTLVVQQSP